MKGGGRGRGNGEESGGARTAPPPATAKSERPRSRKFLWVRPSVSTEEAGFGCCEDFLGALVVLKTPIWFLGYTFLIFSLSFFVR